VERGRDEFSALRGSTELEDGEPTSSGPAIPTATATGIEHEELFRLDEEQGVLIEAGTSTNGSSLRRYYDHPVVCH
jgi:hypothetical protein